MNATDLLRALARHYRANFSLCVSPDARLEVRMIGTVTVSAGGETIEDALAELASKATEVQR